MEAMRRSGVVEKVRWVTAFDERVCPICRPLNNKVWDINSKQVMKPVTDTHPNCFIDNKVPILTDKGYKCLIVEKRNHIGGYCYTENVDGIIVHKYGGHIFHTDNLQIWDYFNKFGSLTPYAHRLKVSYKNKLYSFPINLFTMYQIWGVTNPNDAKKD